MSKRIPLKILFVYSEQTIENIEKLIGDIVAEKILKDLHREAS